MADSKEVRHAGIGLDFNINGLNEFKKLNEAIDKMVGKGKEIRQQFSDLGSSFSGLRSGKDGITEIRDSMQGVTRSVEAARSPLKDINNDVKQVSSSAKEATKSTDFSESLKKSQASIKDAYSAMKDLNDTNKKAANFSVDLSRKLKNAGDIGKEVRNEINFVRPTSESTKAMNLYSESIKKVPTNRFTEVKTKIDAATKSTQAANKSTEEQNRNIDKSQSKVSKLRDVLAGGFIGAAVSNGMSWLYNEMKSITEQGYELAEGGEQIRDQWQNIGLSEKNAHSMTDQIGEIRGQANIAGGALDAMQKKFYAMTGSVSKAKQLTNEISAFGSAAGKSGDQIKSISMGVARLSGGKTVAAGLFQRTFGQLPGLQKAIVKVSGMSTKAFNTALQGGKVTGAKLQEYLGKAAKYSGKQWSQFGSTTKGQMASIEGTLTNLKATFAAPLVDGISEALKTVNKQKGGLGDVKKNLQDITKAAGTKVGNYVGDAIKFLVKNRKPLSDIVSDVATIVKMIGLGVWRTFSGTVSMLTGHFGKSSGSLKTMAGSLNAIAKQRNGLLLVGKALTGIWAVSKFMSAVTWLHSLSRASRESAIANGTLSKSQRVVNAVMNHNVFAIVVTAIAAVTVALVELYKHNRKFRNFVNGLLKWAKKFAVGIGKWFKQAYRDATKWIGKLVSSVAKRWGNLWKDNIRIFKNAWNDIKDILRVFKDIFTGDFSDLKRAIPKLVRDLWKTVKSEFKGAYDFLDDLTGGWISRITKAFSDAWKSIGKGWKSFWNGIDDWFKNLWHGIASHASNGVNDIIGVLNGGISGIDWVISKFGGSNKAIGTISKVHLATGTGVFGKQRRAITRPTMAVLNDGHDSPETGNREILMHPNGLSELIKGVNVTRMLEPGAEVLNASEAKFAMGMDHFAGGTGFFSSIWKGTKNLASSAVSGTEKLASNAWSGVKSGASAIGGFASNAWKGATHLLSTIQKIISSPTKYLEGLIKKPTGTGEILSDFARGFYSSMKKQAKSWWSELWSMASGALDDSGSSSSLLNAMKKYGEGHKYVWGAAGPTSFDCSGLVQYALEHAFGISYPRTSGAQIAKASRVSSSNAKPGDLIGNGEHIGVYAGNGNYYSAMSETTHPNIGMSPVSTFPGTPQYGHVAGIKSDSGSKKAKAGGSSLQKLIKSETGGMLGWITKHLAPLLDTDDGGGPDGGSITHSMVNKALEIAHIPHGMWSKMQHDIIAVAKSETGNRNIMQQIHDVNSANGNPAGGPLQFTKTTFDAFAFPGHHNFRSSLDQTLAYLNNSDYASAAGNTVIWGTPKFDWLHSGPQGHKRYAKGGDVPANQLSIVGEKGWELFKPKSGGHVFDHETSKKILSRGSRNVEIHGATIQMTVNGNADNATVSKLQDALNQSNEALVEKMRETFGLNDEGGLII